jgi:hypothetical protein
VRELDELAQKFMNEKNQRDEILKKANSELEKIKCEKVSKKKYQLSCSF